MRRRGEPVGSFAGLVDRQYVGDPDPNVRVDVPGHVESHHGSGADVAAARERPLAGLEPDARDVGFDRVPPR